MAKRFKIKSTADYGRERFVESVVGVMKISQTDLIIHAVDSYYEKDGRPFMNIARIEMQVDIDLDTVKDWVFDTLRLYYGGPPFVLTVEEDLDPLP